jgi:hypothetical protein
MAKPSGDHITLGGFVLFRPEAAPMIADSHDIDQSRSLQPPPAWAEGLSVDRVRGAMAKRARLG